MVSCTLGARAAPRQVRDVRRHHRAGATGAAPRSAPVLGQTLSAGVRGFSQADAVCLPAPALNIAVDLNPINLVVVALLTGLGSALFSTFSLIIACIYPRIKA
jgi:hypothetical protein